MQSAPAPSTVPWTLAARLLARDWRSGEVLVLFMALVIAVHEVHRSIERSIRDPLERFGREAEVPYLDQRSISRE